MRPPKASAVSPPMMSDSSATPHDADETVAVDALVLPTEDRLLLANEDDVGDREPLGIGVPVVQVAELLLTDPPEPLPVE